MKQMYDYLIVGAGLSGAVFAHEATKRGKKVKVIDKRNHLGGNIYCEEVEGIQVHRYGAHIFHTSNQRIIDVQRSLEAGQVILWDKLNDGQETYGQVSRDDLI